MDWFEKITGFKEGEYRETQARLGIENGKLISDATEKVFAVGKLEIISLADLRSRAEFIDIAGNLSFDILEGNVRYLHADPDYSGALFQVASQFNLLEMIDPTVTPEAGVTCYEYDATQGPACAIAAGAGTIYRNYLVPLGSERGQTRDRQVDVLGDVAEALASSLDMPRSALWAMRNGYALPTFDSLAKINAHLGQAPEAELDYLRSLLRVGLHSDVEVTEPSAKAGTLVSQIYCSAMPVAYSNLPCESWRALASLVLDAAYKATLLSAVVNAARGASNKVLLTRLGGGAFGNDDDLIDAAIKKSVTCVARQGLDVKIVSNRSAPRRLLDLRREIQNDLTTHMMFAWASRRTTSKP